MYSDVKAFAVRLNIFMAINKTHLVLFPNSRRVKIIGKEFYGRNKIL